MSLLRNTVTASTSEERVNDKMVGGGEEKTTTNGEKIKNKGLPGGIGTVFFYFFFD